MNYEAMIVEILAHGQVTKSNGPFGDVSGNDCCCC